MRALALYRYVRHHDFTMTALMLTMGREQPDTSAIEALCRELDVPIVIRHTEIYEILFEWRKDPNPCALCAKMRRGMLCDMCTDRGLNKLALGHHREDALETLMMSVIFEGRLHTFHPCSYMSRSNLTVIRPLIYVPEKHIIHMRREAGPARYQKSLSRQWPYQAPGDEGSAVLPLQAVSQFKGKHAQCSEKSGAVRPVEPFGPGR